MVDVLQSVKPEVPDAHAVRRAVLNQTPGGVGDEDLPAVPRRGDSCGPVDVDPEVVLTAEDTLARVDPHPHADSRSMWPLMRSERPLRGHGCVESTRRREERDEEGVAFRPHLHAVP